MTHEPMLEGCPVTQAKWLQEKVAAHRKHIAEMVEKYAAPDASEEDKAAERLLAERQAAIAFNFRDVVRLADYLSEAARRPDPEAWDNYELGWRDCDEAHVVSGHSSVPFGQKA